MFIDIKALFIFSGIFLEVSLPLVSPAVPCYVC